MTTQEFVEWLDSDERRINDTITLGIAELCVADIRINDDGKTVYLEINNISRFFSTNYYFYVEITKAGYKCYSSLWYDFGDFIDFLITNRDPKFDCLPNCIYINAKSYSVEKLMTYVSPIVDEIHWGEEKSFIIFDDSGIIKTIVMRCAANRLNLTTTNQNIKYAGSILLIIFCDGKEQYTYLGFEYDVDTKHVDIYQNKRPICGDDNTQ